MQRVRAQTNGLENLAKCIAVPHDHPAHRQPTFPALERTAVLSFNDNFTVPVGGATTSAAVLTRDPAYPLWTTQSFNGTMAQYHASTFAVATPPSEIWSPPVEDALPNTNVNMPFDQFPLVTMGGDTFYGVGFTPANISTTFSIGLQFVVAANGPITIGYTYEIIDTSGNRVVRTQERLVPTSSGPNFAALTALGADVIAARIIDITVENGLASTSYLTLSLGITAAAPGANATPFTAPASRAIVRMFPATAPPEFATSNGLVWQDVRATATAALFTNVTAVLAKEGTVSGARVPIRSFPAFNAQSWAGFNAVHPKDRYFGALENGVYTYTLPDIGAETFRDCVMRDANGFAMGVVDMDCMEYATCLLFTDFDVSTTTTLAVNVDRHTEFRTTSRLFPTDFSRLPMETYHASQMALVQMGTIMENPIHLSAIANMAARAARAIWPVVKPHAQAAAATVGSKALTWAAKTGNNFIQKGFSKPKKSTPPPPPPPAQKKRKATRTRK